VEEQAIERAEAECLADGEVRARRREREAERRVELDRRYVRNERSVLRLVSANLIEVDGQWQAGRRYLPTEPD
jgi:hypothetical protein